MKDRKQKKLKRAVIKEELVELTGDFLEAIMLNQLIFWSERVNDYDKMLEEELKRLSEEEEAKVYLKNGWFYKSAPELKEEIMSDKSNATIRRRLDNLVDKGWIHRRNNPKNKQDRTYHYRVDIIQIQKDLMKIGYSLDNYPLLTSQINNLHDEDSNTHNESSNPHSAGSNPTDAGSSENDEGTLPEITTETTSKITTESSKNNNKSTRALEKSSKYSLPDPNEIKQSINQLNNRVIKYYEAHFHKKPSSTIATYLNKLDSEVACHVINFAGENSYDPPQIVVILKDLIKNKIKTVDTFYEHINKFQNKEDNNESNSTNTPNKELEELYQTGYR